MGLLEDIQKLALQDKLGHRAKIVAQISREQEGISDALFSGVSLLQIWKTLTAAERLSCSYPTLRRHLRKRKRPR